MDKAEALPLIPGAQLGDDSIIYLTRAIGAVRSGRPEEARRNVAEIESRHKQVVAKKIPWADWVDGNRKEAEAWANHAEGKNDEAVQLLRGLADKHKEGMFAAQGNLPAREMIGDMLLDMHKPDQALTEYEAQLRINPNRFNSFYGAGQAAEMIKQPDKAASYYGQFLKVYANGSSTRSELRHRGNSCQGSRQSSRQEEKRGSMNRKSIGFVIPSLWRCLMTKIREPLSRQRNLHDSNPASNLPPHRSGRHGRIKDVRCRHRRLPWRLGCLQRLSGISEHFGRTHRSRLHFEEQAGWPCDSRRGTQYLDGVS